MSEDHALDPRFLVIFQLEMSAQSVRQSLAYVYDSRCSVEQRRAAILHLYAQTGYMKELCDTLFTQYRSFERIV